MATAMDEAVAGTSKASGRGRPLINVRQFLESWDTEVTNMSIQMSKRKETEIIAEKMGITTDLADELAIVCGPETLCCGDEPRDKSDLLKMKGLPKNIDLTCVKYQEREVERRRNVDYKLFVINKMKYRMLDVRPIPHDASIVSRDIETENLVPVPNVVLTVNIYRPRVSNTFLPKGEVFQVLGTQYLTDLKDRISCIKDDAIAGEFSNYPNLPDESLTPARKIYKSGLFFIENTFYNDFREGDNRDYSAPILKWANEKSYENAHLFRMAKMEETRFLDLSVDLGVPYLYQHQGQCEHIMVFTDVRLLHFDDPQDLSLYPFLQTETVTKRTICRTCMMDSAQWVVHDSQLTPESPCFMCHSCFTLLHYDQDGQKVCSFRAFKYRQKRTLH